MWSASIHDADALAEHDDIYEVFYVKAHVSAAGSGVGVVVTEAGCAGGIGWLESSPLRKTGAEQNCSVVTRRNWKDFINTRTLSEDVAEAASWEAEKLALVVPNSAQLRYGAAAAV